MPACHFTSPRSPSSAAVVRRLGFSQYGADVVGARQRRREHDRARAAARRREPRPACPQHAAPRAPRATAARAARAGRAASAGATAARSRRAARARSRRRSAQHERAVQAELAERRVVRVDQPRGRTRCSRASRRGTRAASASAGCRRRTSSTSRQKPPSTSLPRSWRSSQKSVAGCGVIVVREVRAGGVAVLVDREEHDLVPRRRS